MIWPIRKEMDTGSLSTTEAEIRGLLGLLDPDDCALAAMRENLSEARVSMIGVREAVRSVYRRTGRTTRLLVRALAHLRRDPSCTVFLDGRSASHRALLVRECRQMAERLGLPSAQVREGSSLASDAGVDAVGCANAVVLVDEATGL